MGGELDVGFVGRILRVLRQERPDLAHLHSRRGADLWGGLAARLAGVPAVLTRRVDNPEPRWAVRWKYRLYARVVAISEAIRGVLLAEGVPADRVTCVHSAVDTETYRPGCDERWFRGEFGLPPEAPVVGTVAQFIARKGHATLLEAVPRVLAHVPQARFLLFGRGPLEASLQASARAPALAGRVAFGGFRNDLDRVLPCLTALAHPASLEGLGVSLLQAAACGVPIVASRAGGMPEVVRDGETGYLVRPGDAWALAEALVQLLEPGGARDRFARTAREQVVREFSVDAMVSGNLAVYREVLGTSI
jgi:glycosyltransferase involved in cell wall biosynthesis